MLLGKNSDYEFGVLDHEQGSKASGKQNPWYVKTTLKWGNKEE